MAKLRGGAYVAACLLDSTGWVARRYSMEKWSFSGGRPTREKNVSLGRTGQKPGLETVHCTDSDVGIKRPNTELEWLNQNNPAQSIGTGAVHRLQGKAVASLSVGQNKRLEFRRTGRAVMEADRFLDWRPVPTDILDAIYDGQFVWAVSHRELWRWTPKTQQVLSVALPTELGQREFESVFRDGNVIWVRTSDGIGWPLSMKSGLGRLVAKPGPLPPIQARVSLPVGVYRIEHKGVGHPLRLIGEDGGFSPFSNEAVYAFLPLARDHLLVSVDKAVELWDLTSQPPDRVKVWPFSGVMTRFFINGMTIYAIGRNSGFHWGKLSPQIGLSNR